MVLSPRGVSSPDPAAAAAAWGAVHSPRHALAVLPRGAGRAVRPLFALPDLLAAAREIPAGEGELSPEELARAREVARSALAGRIPWVFAASFVTLALAIWRGLLPGLRRR
jgi:hypothetical protein